MNARVQDDDEKAMRSEIERAASSAPAQGLCRVLRAVEEYKKQQGRGLGQSSLIIITQPRPDL